MIAQRRTLLWIVVFTTATAAGARAAQPVARVLEVNGKIVAQNAAGKERPLDALDTVYLGEKVLLATDCHAVLAFRADGHLERLKSPGKFTVGKDGCEPKTGVEVVEVPDRHKRAVVGAVRQLSTKGPGGVTIVRSPPPRKPPPPREPTPQISPIDGSTVLTTRPKFCWPAVAKAERYEVGVYAGSDKLWSAATAQTQIEHSGKSALQPGVRYDWEVLAVFADGSAKRVYGGEFTLATEEQEQRAAELKDLATGPETALLALAAAWYEEQEMTIEATAAYERLAALRPNVAAFQLALVRLYRQVERAEDAAKALHRARQLQPPPTKPPGPDAG